MVLDIGIGHVFAWGLMLLCIIILLVQIIPFVIDLFRVFIDWWDFQLGSLDKESRGGLQSEGSLKFFARRPGRLLYLFSVCVLFSILFDRSAILAIVVALLGLAAPILLHYKQSQQHRIAIEQALPDAMTKLAALIGAGQPLHQAIVELPERVDPALRPCFAQLRSDLKLGISLSDSLKRHERRLDLQEFTAFASCLRVGLSTGGTLAPSIERLARDMRNRLNLRMKLRVLTVQARGQAWIMSALPFLILIALSVVDPSSFEFLLNTNPGRSALSLALGMNVLGAFWVRRLSQSKWV